MIYFSSNSGLKHMWPQRYQECVWLISWLTLIILLSGWTCIGGSEIGQGFIRFQNFVCAFLYWFYLHSTYTSKEEASIRMKAIFWAPSFLPEPCVWMAAITGLSSMNFLVSLWNIIIRLRERKKFHPYYLKLISSLVRTMHFIHQGICFLSKKIMCHHGGSLVACLFQIIIYSMTSIISRF